MIVYLGRIQIYVTAGEIRRSQYTDASVTIVRQVRRTKGALRIDKRRIIVTEGLPKGREAQGNGDLIVPVFMQKRNYTVRVTPEEWEVSQQSCDDKENLLNEGRPENNKTFKIYKNI